MWFSGLWMQSPQISTLVGFGSIEICLKCIVYCVQLNLSQ
jgi:hypothetical protein